MCVYVCVLDKQLEHTWLKRTSSSCCCQVFLAARTLLTTSVLVFSCSHNLYSSLARCCYPPPCAPALTACVCVCCQLLSLRPQTCGPIKFILHFDWLCKLRRAMGTPRPSAPFPPITHQLFCLATALSLLVFLFYLRNAYDLINIYKYLVLNNFKESNKRKVIWKLLEIF